MVYRSNPGSKIHFDPECETWARSRSSGPLVAYDLRELKGTKFCRTCTPARLHRRPQTIHEKCDICGWGRVMPCQHNGGLPVVNIDEMMHYGHYERRVNIRWRWPENVIGAPLADYSPDGLAFVYI